MMLAQAPIQTFFPIWTGRQSSTIYKSFLGYEKGDARLQKRFTVDYLARKTKVNEGENSQYYINNNHPYV